MKSKRILRVLAILVILGSNVGCDQVSKSVVRSSIGYTDRIGFMNDHVTLMKVENTGAFLSIGESLPRPVKLLVLVILPLAGLALALVFLFVKKGLPARALAGICFIAGGGIGNIYDRMIYGSVTDFLHINFGIIQTGVFNMADVSVMTGALILIVESSFGRADWLTEKK